MKIRKYQAGAIIYTPTPTGGQATSTQTSASSSSASENQKNYWYNAERNNGSTKRGWTSC